MTLEDRRRGRAHLRSVDSELVPELNLTTKSELPREVQLSSDRNLFQAHDCQVQVRVPQQSTFSFPTLEIPPDIRNHDPACGQDGIYPPYFSSVDDVCRNANNPCRIRLQAYFQSRLTQLLFSSGKLVVDAWKGVGP